MEFKCGKSKEYTERERIRKKKENEKSRVEKYRKGWNKFLWWPTTIGVDEDGNKICRWLETVHISYPNAQWMDHWEWGRAFFTGDAVYETSK